MGCGLGRKTLRECAESLARNAEEKTYDYWSGQAFPVTYEDSYKGHPVQVEIDMLEKTTNHIHIMFAVSGNWFSDYFPATATAIVLRLGKP
jgi:hypothetical protein